MADAGDMSKSAKKRAAKKARDAAHAEPEVVEEPPAPAPKAKAKGKAKAEPAPVAAPPKAAAAAPKAAAAAPKASAAAPKAKAAGKAAPAPEAAPEKAPAAKAKAKADAKAEPKASGKKKKAPKAEEAPAPVAEVVELAPGTFLDDGSGWDGVVKKKEIKKKPKSEEKAEDTKQAGASPTTRAPASRPAPVPGTHREAAVRKAEDDIARIFAMKAPVQPASETAGEGEEKAPPPSDIVTLQVPDARIGAVIGPKGATIKLIQDSAEVKIDTAGSTFTIAGHSPESVAKAKGAIEEIIEKGYTSLNFEDFAESSVNVHPSHFPDLIGTKGAIIQGIKKALNVEVSIPKVPNDAPAGKKFKVGLAGEAKNVETAKEVIDSIVHHYHHEVTHPGEKHEELDIETEHRRFIIGSGGSQMKHIQKNWTVRVYIPKEHAANQKVQIVGQPDNVDRAKAYVEKMVVEAATKPRGREAGEAADDGWGDEAPDEAWMKGYVYKR
jgi:rRNA processing protein Krr1/Pno1